MADEQFTTEEVAAGRKVMEMSVSLLTALYKHDVPTIMSVLEVSVADVLVAADVDPDDFIARVKETRAFLLEQKAKGNRG